MSLFKFHVKHVFTLIFLVFVMLGCAQSKKVLNLTENSPDEFAVIRKKPLVIPPKFNLRPPQNSQSESDKFTSKNEAKTALLGSDSAKKNTQKSSIDASKGEVAFLAKSGISSSDVNIRKILEEENSRLASYNNSFVQKLVSSVTGEDKKNLIDPKKEQKRLQEKRSTDLTNIKGQQQILIRRK